MASFVLLLCFVFFGYGVEGLSILRLESAVFTQNVNVSLSKIDQNSCGAEKQLRIQLKIGDSFVARREFPISTNFFDGASTFSLLLEEKIPSQLEEIRILLSWICNGKERDVLCDYNLGEQSQQQRSVLSKLIYPCEAIIGYRYSLFSQCFSKRDEVSTSLCRSFVCSDDYFACCREVDKNAALKHYECFMSANVSSAKSKLVLAQHIASDSFTTYHPPVLTSNFMQVVVAAVEIDQASTTTLSGIVSTVNVSMGSTWTVQVALILILLAVLVLTLLVLFGVCLVLRRNRIKFRSLIRGKVVIDKAWDNSKDGEEEEGDYDKPWDRKVAQNKFPSILFAHSNRRKQQQDVRHVEPLQTVEPEYEDVDKNCSSC